MLVLNSNSALLTPSSKTGISASGGVEPYTFSLVSGEAGGSLLGGVYTAPDTPLSAFQTIRVVDSTSAEATFRINIVRYEQLICEIIRSEMSLEQDQVIIYNQKLTIPRDNRIHIAIKVMDLKFINVKRQGTIQSYTGAYTIQIDIMSKSESILFQKEDVVLALNSQKCKNLQTQCGFYIASLPTTFVDLSQIEGPAIPYRFTTQFKLHYTRKKVSGFTYFDEIQNFNLITEE